MKRCPGCREMKPREAFAADQTKRDGLKSRCSACDNARCRSYYIANFETVLAKSKARNDAKRALRPPKRCATCPAPVPTPKHRYCADCGRRARMVRVRSRSTWERAAPLFIRCLLCGNAHVDGIACPETFAIVEDEMPGTSDRGYGNEHQKLRRQVARIVALGTAKCARCGDVIHPDEGWDLGHDDHDRTRYTGPEHIRCNRATAAHRAAPIRTSRVW